MTDITPQTVAVDLKHIVADRVRTPRGRMLDVKRLYGCTLNADCETVMRLAPVGARLFPSPREDGVISVVTSSGVEVGRLDPILIINAGLRAGINFNMYVEYASAECGIPDIYVGIYCET